MTRTALFLLAALSFLMLSGCATMAPTSSGFSPLYTAVIHNNIDEVRRLLAAGTDVNGKTMADFTALRGAAQLGRIEIARLLIAKGANVNAIAIDSTTPLMAAVQFGQAEMVRLLIANGANIYIRSTLGKTALDYTKDFNHPELHSVLMGTDTRNSPPPKLVKAVEKKEVEPAPQNISEIKSLIAKKNMKGLVTYLDAHPEELN